MNISPLSKILVLWMLQSFCVSAMAIARGGATGVGGGGDLCENRIKVVRDDIKKWILEGGPQGLQLPEGLTVTSYSQNMLKQIRRSHIQCVRQGDKSYPVEINGTAKTCRFLKSKDRSQIICDFEKFQSISEPDQYILIHHEYAGLAELESSEDDSSTYFISNQISGHLEDQVVKKLKVSHGSSIRSGLTQPVSIEDSDLVMSCQGKSKMILAFKSRIDGAFSWTVYQNNAQDIHNIVYDRIDGPLVNSEGFNGVTWGHDLYWITMTHKDFAKTVGPWRAKLWKEGKFLENVSCNRILR